MGRELMSWVQIAPKMDIKKINRAPLSDRMLSPLVQQGAVDSMPALDEGCSHFTTIAKVAKPDPPRIMSPSARFARAHSNLFAGQRSIQDYGKTPKKAGRLYVFDPQGPFCILMESGSGGPSEPLGSIPTASKQTQIVRALSHWCTRGIFAS